MCGIAGYFNFNNELADRTIIKALQSRLIHRGPDSTGIFVEGAIGLSHCRLKIIDLSDHADQPMTDESFGTTIVYNGEIYNYLELRDQLKSRGHRFRSDSDTEVILKSYAEWGTDCLSRFNGMFAFALWDKPKQRLFCARDRFGVKPFYYCFTGSRFYFASEIKAVLGMPSVQARANLDIVHDFLVYGLVDHTHETFFDGIIKLPPSHYMIVTSQGIQTCRYWSFQISEAIEMNASADQFAEDFRELLSDSVRVRLRSDVPVGTCLSGGIDSSSITCLIHSHISGSDKHAIGKRLNTYSAVFDTPGLDERSYIREVVDYTGAYAHWISPSISGLLDELDTLVWHQEEPFSSTSIYAQWCIFRKIRDTGVKVVLDGQGADEQLGGYRKFYYFFLKELVKRKKYGTFFDEILHVWKNLFFFQGTDIFQSLRYFHRSPQWKVLFSVISRQLRDFRKDRNSLSDIDSISKRMHLDMTRFSLPSLLRYEDKNSMAFSIESRTPFLDFRLVEYLASLPLQSKIHQGWTKNILRQAMKDVIPESVRLRRDKLAFDTPQQQWLKNELMTPVMKSFRDDGLISFCLNRENLLKEFERYVSGTSWLPGNFFFRVFVLQKWTQRFSVTVR